MRTVRLSAAEAFWYVLGCIFFGAMYFAKIPAKKAFAEAGLARMTDGERVWYTLACVAFGAGYLAKLPVKKALSEIAYLPEHGYDQTSFGDELTLRRHAQPRAQHAGPRTELLRLHPPAPRHAQHDTDADAWLTPLPLCRAPGPTRVARVATADALEMR